MPEMERIAALLAEGTPEAAWALQEIAETTMDKAARKEARRALYRLRLAGILPPERTAEPVRDEARTEERETLQAWASAFDGAGNRLLFLALPDPHGGH